MSRENISKNDRIRGSLIAGAIGDALGYPIEFKTGIKDRRVKKYPLNRGIISDDTQMTLFTADALLWRETKSLNDGVSLSYDDALYLGYLDWLETQTKKVNNQSISWIKNISELNEKRAPGNTCLSSLLSGKKGTTEFHINDSKGCGTVMRIAPIGLYILDPIYAAKVAADASAITHGHELGMIPSYFEAILLNTLLNENLTFEESLDKTINLFKENNSIFSIENNTYFLNLINTAINLSKTSKSDVEAIKSLGGGWVAEEAFAIALYSCLKYQNSVKDALICAVNHDGDSDSTGAIAGNIIGTYLGFKAIDNYYINHLELKDTILELADDLSSDVKTKINDEDWKNKYVNLNYSVKAKKGLFGMF